MNQRIEPDIAKLILKLSYNGTAVSIPMQLDRPTYVRLNKVLELAGGKWNKKAKAHLFEESAEEVLLDAAAQGQIFDRKKAMQFFPTPANLADEMVQAAGIRNLTDGSLVLEPSAGSGNIVKAIKRANPGVHMVACELDRHHADKLKASGADAIVWEDFLRVQPIGPFNAIVMNPPFRNLQDIAHFMKAYELLTPGGTLVCLTSPSWQFRTTGICAGFRKFISNHNARVTEVPSGTFPDTDIRTLLITLTK